MNIGFTIFDEVEGMESKEFVIYRNSEGELHHMNYACDEHRLLKEHNQRYCWAFRHNHWLRYARKFGNPKKFRSYPTNRESLPSAVRLYLILMDM